MTSAELNAEYHRLFDAIVTALAALNQQQPAAAHSILRQAMWYPQTPPPKPYGESQ